MHSCTHTIKQKLVVLFYNLLGFLQINLQNQAFQELLSWNADGNIFAYVLP